MRIIVCGGRDYDSATTVANTFDGLPRHGRFGPHIIVHGACKVLNPWGGQYELKRDETPGADRLAHFLALALGWHVEPHAANWNRDGSAAGPMRNREMARLGADLCIAFPGGRGTAGMVDFARERGIPVREVPR